MNRRNPRQLVIECAALESRRLLCMTGDLAGLSSVPLPQGEEESPIHVESAGPESIDQLNVPALSSRPAAARKLYLDFNGHPTIEGWGGWAIGGEDAGPTQAFSTDDDDDAFSGIELGQIEKIWKGVSEKFSPFNVDVTTIRPSTINGARIVIGGDGSWHGSGGGVALVGGWGEEGFTDVKGANVAFVWAGQQNSNLSYIVEAIAHEAGHTMDLYHQSRNQLTAPGNEYLAGFIMGSGSAGIGRWAHTSFTGPGGVSSTRDGESIVSRGGQDDLTRITDTGDNGFGFRVDDAPDNTLQPGQVTLPITSHNGVLQNATQGVIETNDDVDVYRFTHSGGSLDIEVLAAEFRRMLDPNLRLRRFVDANGNTQVVATSSVNNGSDGVGERIQINQLNAGNYVIDIGASGTYGDIGQYRLNIRAGSPQASNDTLGTATRLGAFGRTTAEFLALGFAGTANITDSLQTIDEADYFRVVIPGNLPGRLTARLTGPTSGGGSTTGATLTIVNDLNGDGLVGPFGTEASLAPDPVGGVQSLSQEVTGGSVRYVRVERVIQPINSYQLRITLDSASRAVTATSPSVTAFDPAPLHGSRLVNESIDQFASDTFSVAFTDTTDHYRVTAAAAGLFSFTLFLQDNTGDLRLDVGTDTNLNGFLEAGEFLASSAQSGIGAFEQINNLAVTQGQRVLVKVSQQTNTSDNYVLQAIADYSTGSNLIGALTNATDLTSKAAATFTEYLAGGFDTFDVYKIAPPIGTLTARLTALELGAGHRLEIIRDGNNNAILDAGEIVATGVNGQLLSHLVGATFPFGPPFYYLRVASVTGGEFPSVGNYKLTFATAGAVSSDSPTTPTTINPLSFAIPFSAYLAFEPNEASLNDLEDFYQFNITARTQFVVSTNNTAIGVQVGRLNGSSFERIGGVGTFQGTVNALSVNLDPGTYLLRTYLPLAEQQDEPSGGSFSFSFNTAAVTDNSPPVVTATEFQYEIKPVGPIFTVDQDVLGSIDPTDVVVRNLGTNVTFPIDQTYYDRDTRQIGYGVAAGTLPDGNYRATLLAGSLRDASANTLAANSSFEFFVFAGDANRDRSVNIADFSILATRFNLLGTFSQGDFNYDHIATIADFSILASKFNTSLAAADLPRGGMANTPPPRDAATRMTQSRPTSTFGSRLIEELGDLEVEDASI